MQYMMGWSIGSHSWLVLFVGGAKPTFLVYGWWHSCNSTLRSDPVRLPRTPPTPFFSLQQQQPFSFSFIAMSDESALPFNVPGWVSYLLSFTGLAGLTGAALLYLYQCEIIYPSSFPEGSRTQVTSGGCYSYSALLLIQDSFGVVGN